MATEYYRVTINAAGLGGAAPADGFIDSVSQYPKLAKAYSTVSAPTLVAGNDITINGVRIVFSSTTLASLISDINKASVLHGCVASAWRTNYMRVQNMPAQVGQVIQFGEGSIAGDLATIGLPTTGIYGYPDVVGSSFTNLTNTETMSINGVVVTFTTGGGLNLAGVVSTINASAANVYVKAYAAGDLLQIVSLNSSPIVLADPTAGVLAKLGLTVGTFEGQASSVANSRAKARANLRWDGIMKSLTRDFKVSQVFNIGFSGADVNTAASGSSAVTFTVIAHDTLTADESNAGQYLTHTAAIKRSIARAFITPWSGNQNVFDPTAAAVVPGKVGTRYEYITADKLTSSLSTAETAITVDFVGPTA